MTELKAQETAELLGPQAEICEFCGLAIEASDQECPALDDGVCRP